MAKAYRLTAARKVALRKAQLISARKRKGHGLSSRTKRNLKIGATGVGIATVLGTGAYARHKLSGSQLYVGQRSATPTTEIVGVKIPVTRAGFKHVGYGAREGFVTSLTSRNARGDKHMFYRHKPLTLEHMRQAGHRGVIVSADAIRSVIGRPIKGDPRSVTQWKPRAATESDIHKNVVKAINERTVSGSRILGAFTSEGKAKRRVMRKDSTGTRQYARKTIPLVEAMARANEYERRLAGQGIMIGQDHKTLVTKMFGREVY